MKGRQQDGQSADALCRYNFIDITCALGIALLINVAVLLVSASTFFSTGDPTLLSWFCGFYSSITNLSKASCINGDLLLLKVSAFKDACMRIL